MSGHCHACMGRGSSPAPGMEARLAAFEDGPGGGGKGWAAVGGS